MSATLRSGRPVEFKLRVQVSLPSQAFFFSPRADDSGLPVLQEKLAQSHHEDPDMMIKVHWICFPFVMWKLFLAMNMRQKSQTNTSVTALIVLLTLLIRKDLTCQQKPIIASLLV